MPSLRSIYRTRYLSHCHSVGLALAPNLVAVLDIFTAAAVPNNPALSPILVMRHIDHVTIGLQWFPI